jgi:hypothetical protein
MLKRLEKTANRGLFACRAMGFQLSFGRFIATMLASGSIVFCLLEPSCCLARYRGVSTGEIQQGDFR